MKNLGTAFVSFALSVTLAFGGLQITPSGSGGVATTDFDTSGELRTILTDETGTGADAFATSPTLTGTVSLTQAVANDTTLTLNGLNPSSGGAPTQAGRLEMHYYSGNAVSNLVLGTSSAGGPNIRLQVDGVTSHVGLNLGGTAYSGFTVQRDVIGGPAQFQIRGPAFEAAGSGAATSFLQNNSLIQIQSSTNIVEFGNGTNGQTLRVYNTSDNTDLTAAPTNYERGFDKWVSNVYKIGTEKGGTGTARGLTLQTDGTDRLTIASNGVANFLGTLGVAGELSPSGVNTTAGSFIYWAGRTSMDSPSNGVLHITNNAGSKGAALAFQPLSPAQITANTNNYNAGLADTLVRLSTDASRNLTGLTFTAAQIDGQVHVLVNVGAQDIVLVNESGSSTDVNRFHNSTGGDITMTPDQEVNCWYDGTTQRWRVTKRGF